MDENITRDYALSELPTLELPRENGELLKAIYTEVNANYRYLADIRFKLLGFVPAISVIAWVELLDKIRPDALHRAFFGIIVSLLALRAIYGIRIYDKRNDGLYNDLVSRGRKIEDEMGVGTGIFKGRIRANQKDKIFNKVINHGRGLSLIYSSVNIGWTIITMWYVYGGIILLLARLKH